MTASAPLRFGDFELDTERYELRRHGRPVAVEPMVFDLIAHFARHPDRVFSRDELIEAVWAGRIVSDATVSTCVKSARKALGDSGGAQAYIRTVRGRGFRFVAEVAAAATPTPTPTPTPRPPAAQTAPALLVLPFRVLADDTALTHFAEGLAEALNTLLTRVPLLRLSSQATRYAGCDLAPGAREVHDALGVDYLLDGSIQVQGGQLRLTAQLADAAAGFRLWAETFRLPGPAESALDAAVIAIVGKLEPQLQRAIYRSVCAAEGERNAHALYLEASSVLALQGWHPASFGSAAALLRQSEQRDRGFALAPACLALVRGLGHRIGVVDDRAQARTEAFGAAERALQLDNMDSTVLGFAGCALADIGHLDRALAILQNAVELNPANAQAWAALGAAQLLRRQVDAAIAHLRHGIEISPLDSRLSVWGALLAAALLAAGDRDGAVAQAELACRRDDRNYLPRVVLAGVRLAGGEQQEARAALADAQRIAPVLGFDQVAPLVGRTLAEGLLALPPAG